MSGPPLTVAFLGTGTMGAPMAANIARSGLTVRVWNRTADRARPLEDHSATVTERPEHAVEGADVVVTMLADAGPTLEVAEAVLPALGAGQGGRELPARVLGGDAVVEDEHADGAASGHQRGVLGSWAMVRATLPGLVPAETRPVPMRWRATAKRACQPLNGRERRSHDHLVP